MPGRRQGPEQDLCRRLATDAVRRARRCGVEHEYVVRRAGEIVDFGSVVREVPLPGARIDPIDPNAFRQSWGGAITADGAEAEIVTPPVLLEAGSSARVAALTASGHRSLRDALVDVDESFALAGYSTHVNVEVPDRASVRIARRVVDHCSADLMLLIDRTTSPGLLIRPRRGRLEIGGDYLVNHQLAGALTFAAAAAVAAGGGERRALPPRLTVHRQAADTRYGWYVDRRAFGVDLYAEGRHAVLRTRRGTIRAGDHLAAGWATLRTHAEVFSSTDELAVVDRLVDGRDPIPLEHADDELPAPDGSRSLPHGAILDERRHGGLCVVAQVATWDAVLFRVTDHHARSCVVNVPDGDVARFLDLLDHGELDDLLQAATENPSGRILVSEDQTTTAGIWDDVADPAVLAPRERDLETGRIGGGGEHRPDKGQSSRSLPGRPGRSRPRWLVLVAIGGAVVVALAAGAAVVASSGGSDDSPRLDAPAAPVTVSDDELSGTYSARIENVRTTESGGNLSGVEATLSGQTVTYASPDGGPQSLAFPGGTVTLECVDGTCTATGPSGLDTVVIEGVSVHGTSPGVNGVLTACHATGPAGAAGTGDDVPMRVQRATANGPDRVTSIRYRGIFAFGRRPTASSGGDCVGFIVGDFDVVLTRV